MHDRAEHRFRLLLLCGISLWKGNAGAQNAVLMQVVRQRIKHRAAIVPARAHQRDFTAEVNTLLNDALAVALIRQRCGFVGAQAPLTAAVVAAGAALDDRQLAQRAKYRRPLAFISQQLPRRGCQVELVEQLLLRQAIGEARKNIAVNERRMVGQLARQRGFRPALDFRRNHALRDR